MGQRGPSLSLSSPGRRVVWTGCVTTTGGVNEAVQTCGLAVCTQRAVQTPLGRVHPCRCTLQAGGPQDSPSPTAVFWPFCELM